MSSYIDRLYSKALDCRELSLVSQVPSASERYNAAAHQFESAGELFRKGSFEVSALMVDIGYISLRSARTAETIAGNERAIEALNERIKGLPAKIGLAA